MARVPDPYLIPGTNVLRNLVGATDEDALAAAENDLCSARAAILREDLPPAEGTLEQLRRIHRFLFQDVYDWAGEIRVFCQIEVVQNSVSVQSEKAAGFSPIERKTRRRCSSYPIRAWVRLYDSPSNLIILP